MFVRLFDCRLYDCMTVEFEGNLNKLDSSLLLRKIILLSTTAQDGSHRSIEKQNDPPWSIDYYLSTLWNMLDNSLHALVFRAVKSSQSMQSIPQKSLIVHANATAWCSPTLSCFLCCTMKRRHSSMVSTDTVLCFTRYLQGVTQTVQTSSRMS